MAEKKTPIRVGFYDIEKTIGKGNFAVVKLARHRLTKTEVAIKIIDKTQLGAADLRRAYREVRVLKKLHHPHIIRLYQVMETKNMLYIVTEYAHQGEIFDHIAQHGRLPETMARRLYWQVVSAVEYCHRRGVVHRDLKAENLLLDMEGSLKVADFGFSTWWSQESVLSTWCGSPPYAAPEVFEGRQYTGPEVDIWSLGVVLYVLVCGALPFDAATLPALRDRVLSARYRVPYFMSSECESLVRKMLVRDPSRRYSIEQIKHHRWMQADGPPRLLPTPGHPLPSTVNPKQYLDPGLVPDIITEPNDQILRLMSSLGIDSSRTRESLRQQSYDHHAAIYFLLLERLRQHRPEGRGYSGGPAVAVRMLSTDSSTCRRAPRRPSSIAEHAMRKMVPGTSADPNPVFAQLPPVTGGIPESSRWKYHRPSNSGPSQTSSIDEGVADMDSGWDPELSSSAFSGNNSSTDSGILPPALPSTRGDWKWPARGSTSSSVLMSTDMSQTSGSPRESVSGSGTTLSSWDSAWEPGGLAASLPSCAGGTNNPRNEERRNSIVGPDSPLSPSGPCLTVDRLWVPPVHHPGSPTEFRLGRRASDGLVGGRRLMSFTNKLEGARAGGVAELADKSQTDGLNSWTREIDPDEEGCVGEPPMSELPLNILCSPAKRPSLPESWRVMPDTAWLSRDHSGVNTQLNLTNDIGATSTQLHRQLMALRLQNKRSGAIELAGDLNKMGESDNSRKSVLRQQSYKLAQQQPVLPPLPGGQPIALGLDHRVFRSITEEESRLHVHEEEEEEEEDEAACVEKLEAEARQSPWPSSSSNDGAWQSLPVTLGDCKLTDSNISLSRLSPLLHLSHLQTSLSSSPNPYQWDQNLHLPQSSLGQPENMDTTGSS